MGFFATLEARVQQTGSLLCVGLDPHSSELSASTAEAARDFCLRLIEQTAELAAAFKPNAAFFEVFGAAGWAALHEVIAAVPSGVPVILDAKRGDIASTAQAYAEAAFAGLGAHAITLNPYLGRDSLTPFLADPARGAFILCKTSNPGAADLQDLPVRTAGVTRPLWEQVARLAQSWNKNDNLGLVVGATHPDALHHVRAVAPDLWILAPGVGAQGGDLNAALAAGLRRDGLGLLVPVSRTLARADDPRAAARALVNAMTEARQQAVSRPVTPAPHPVALPLTDEQAALADHLLAAGCVRFGEFTLKSGLRSPIYLDLRAIIAHPALLRQVAEAYVPVLRGLTFDRLAALPYAALPIGAAVSLAGDWPLIYPRKEVKTYGTAASIEGASAPGERVVVLDDLATTGDSKLEAIEKLQAAGLTVQDVVVLIDRQSGARAALAAAGYTLHAALTLTSMLDYWQQTGRVPAEQLAAARAFLAEHA